MYNTKTYLPTLLLFVLLFSLKKTDAQIEDIRCGTTELTEKNKSEIPGYANELIQNELALKEWVNHHPDFRLRGTVTIPVVVHVLYFAGDPDSVKHQNLSDWQITSEIDAMNEDYSRLNADAHKTPGAFLGDTAITGIQFCLAKRDPDGNHTTGIIHKQTVRRDFNNFDSPKKSDDGGDDGWPHNDYLNIWICGLSSGVLGFSTIPTKHLDSLDGCVIHYKAFGRINTLSKKYNLGRTGTHEVGHWLNLYHLWGDGGSNCSGTDYCDDTPPQATNTFGSPDFPKTDDCSKNAPGIMFMNYMDYSNDTTMNIFTKDQKTRMWFALDSLRKSIFSSNACDVDSSYALDIGISAITKPTLSLGRDTIYPEVTLTNYGSTTLTSATIYYKLNYKSALHHFDWTGNLASHAEMPVSLPQLGDSLGYQLFVAYTKNPNGGQDADTTNDFRTRSYYVNYPPPPKIKDDHFYIYNPESPNAINLNLHKIVLRFDTLSMKDIKQFEVTNILGQRVLYLSIPQNRISKHELELDVSPLPSGMYFVRVLLDRDYMDEKLIIVRGK